jgi:hypothetical protein
LFYFGSSLCIPISLSRGWYPGEVLEAREDSVTGLEIKVKWLCELVGDEPATLWVPVDEEVRLTATQEAKKKPARRGGGKGRARSASVRGARSENGGEDDAAVEEEEEAEVSAESSLRRSARARRPVSFDNFDNDEGSDAFDSLGSDDDDFGESEDEW